MAESRVDPMVSSGEDVEVNGEVAEAIERAIDAADQGRVVPSDEVRKLVPQWISKFSIQNQR